MRHGSLSNFCFEILLHFTRYIYFIIFLTNVPLLTFILIIDRVKYLKNGEEDGREINAIIQELPSFNERVTRVVNTIEDKEKKVDVYLKESPEVDLIVNDHLAMIMLRWQMKLDPPQNSNAPGSHMNRHQSKSTPPSPNTAPAFPY